MSLVLSSVRFTFGGLSLRSTSDVSTIEGCVRDVRVTRGLSRPSFRKGRGAASTRISEGSM